MKIQINISKEFDAKYLRAKRGVRFWEDASVNGVEDTEDGGNIPCKEGDYWCPLIDIDAGQILNWEKGKTASIHYKVCDDGTYFLLDAEKNEIKEINGYVPDVMCPAGKGYGDYVIMEIDENGFIQNWKPNLDAFTTQD